MACGVVRRFQTIDIHVHDDQASIAATRSGDLMFKLFQSRPALPRSGERVDSGGVARSGRQSAGTGRQFAIGRGLAAILHRLDPVCGRPLAVGLCALPIAVRS